MLYQGKLSDSNEKIVGELKKSYWVRVLALTVLYVYLFVLWHPYCVLPVRFRAAVFLL